MGNRRGSSLSSSSRSRSNGKKEQVKGLKRDPQSRRRKLSSSSSRDERGKNKSKRDDRRSKSQDRNNKYGGEYRNQRLSREEVMAQRVEDRNNLFIRNTIWEYSTDEEDYENEIEEYWKKQLKEKISFDKEKKKSEEKKRIKKLKKLQKYSDEDAENSNENLSQYGLSSEDQESEEENKDPERKKNQKNQKNQKSKRNYGNQSEDDGEEEEEEDPGFESDDSFSRMCRQKLNGPDKKKSDKLKLKNKANNKNKDKDDKNLQSLNPKDQSDPQNQGGDEIEQEDDTENQQDLMIDTYLQVGPMPLMLMENKRDNNYTGLLPGEGDAIAHYVEEGKRIPRRGEVGLTSEQIQRFEDLGYVMSGSRHRRMNAVRQMKEDKVISQQQKKALTIYNYQQKNKVESKLDAYFKGMLEEKLGANKIDED